MTDEFCYRGFIIKARTRASPGGGWTHDGLVKHDLRHAVDDHLFCAPGRSAHRNQAVKVIVAYGQRIIDERL
jgi:hypothetical protein